MQNDNNNQQSQSPSVSVNREKVIEPSESLKQELQAQQPTRDADVNPEAQVSQPQPQIQNQPNAVATPSATNSFPVGMSASQLGLNNPRKERTWIKKAVIVAVALVLVAGGYLFLKDAFTGMSTRSLTNGGYSYSFTFYKTANLVQLSDGSQAYKFMNNVIAAVKPTNDNLPISCSEIGSQWHEAFNVQINGSTRPVCTPNNASYAMIFTALNHNHLFTIVYTGQQASSVYPKLQTIFESVKVTQ